LRQDYEKFVEIDSEIISIGPEDAEAFKKYWEENKLPFIGLPDPTHQVLKLYGQQIKIFKYGRMPGQLIIDKNGLARFVHYGKDMRDYPTNAEMIEILASFV
jgi:peroxiredoxin Q/BCP